MTNQNNAAQSAMQETVLTDLEIQETLGAIFVASHPYGRRDALSQWEWEKAAARAIESALLSKLRAPVAPAEVMDALNWVDDFIARCNRDDRGSCESVNILRRALSAPVADERAAFSRAQVSFPLTIPENRVYLAGPMTGHEDHNFPAFHAAAKRLGGLGLEVVNPADHGLVSGLGWSDYMRWDLVKLAGCHAVYVLPGWEKSKGASLEVSIARALGMPVLTVDGAALASAPVAGEAVAWLDPNGDPYCNVITAKWKERLANTPSRDNIERDHAAKHTVALTYAAPQASEAQRSCPSGDGSVRPPCAKHPRGSHHE